MQPPIQGFRTFLRLRSRHVHAGGRAVWDDVSRFDFTDDEREALAGVERARTALRSNDVVIPRIDFGAGPRNPWSVRRPQTVRRLARRASVSKTWGRLLFRLARAVHAIRMLELGTCLGVSAAYLQVALDLNQGEGLSSIEGDPALCELARQTLASVSSKPGRVIEGRFGDVLPGIIDSSGPFDLLFLDGHHDAAAVEAYFMTLRPALSPGAVVILDDIHPIVGPVRPAWRAIDSHFSTDWKVDLLRMGVFRVASAQ